MCDHADETPANPDPNRKTLSRRDFVGGLGGALGAAFLLPGTSLTAASARASSLGMTEASPSGLFVVSNAMHIHSSFSELDGSFQSHLAEAARCGVQVLWPTDHDWRMQAIGYLTTLRFMSGEKSNGASVSYKASSFGAPVSSVCALDTSTHSPNDTSGGSVHVAARAPSGLKLCGRRMNVQPSNLLRSNLTGETLTFDALPLRVGPDAWLEVLVNLSYHSPLGGRPAGIYQLSYRLGTAPASHQANGRLGVVTVPMTPGQWNTGITLDPVSDIAALWPDLAAPGDNNMGDLWFGVNARNGATGEGYFANGLISRSKTGGDDPLSVQSEILAALAAQYPTVHVRRALEISLNPKHSNWFGGSFHMPDYSTLATGDITAVMTAKIHGYGGLATVNHPFGVSKAVSSQATQDAARQTVAKKYLANRCYGADILEVGYHARGGASLETHLALWDTLSRNAIFLTGNGVTDNHTGHVNAWSVDGSHNTFTTQTWTASDSEADLLDSLRRGQVYCGEVLVFTGELWTSVDGNPMGSVSVSSATSRQLSVSATGLTSSMVVEVVRGPVDYAGSANPNPGTATVSTLPASAFTSGSASITVDTSSACFVRINVLDTAVNRRVAFANPIWLLRATPPNGIPAARKAPDTP